MTTDKQAVKDKFKLFARMGYCARGVIYLVIGGLALMAVFTGGGETTDSKGAIQSIGEQPFGDALLVLLIIGLVGYSVWRCIQCFADVDDHGTSAKGLAVRAGLLGSAIAHILLAWWTVTWLMGSASDGSGNTWGGWLYGLAGAIAIGVGIAHIFKGWTARFERYMNIPADKKSWISPISRVGLIGRGVVWCVIGGILIESALTASENDKKGVAEALNTIASNQFGSILLFLVAAGLFAFGMYSVFEAKYRKIQVPS